MQRSLDDIDFDFLNNTIAALQRSARRTLPMFAIGIAATLIAGALAVYYVFGLWNDLRVTTAQLQQTQRELAQARLVLARTGAVLQDSQTAASPANASRIAAAIEDVSKTEQKLTSVAQSLNKATVALPAQGVSEPEATLTGTWTDQYGTIYEVRQDGSQFRYQAAFKNAETLGPAARGSARGKVDGSRITYTYSDGAGNRYNCQSNVSADGRQIQETCRTARGKPLHVTLVRT